MCRPFFIRKYGDSGTNMTAVRKTTTKREHTMESHCHSSPRPRQLVITIPDTISSWKKEPRVPLIEGIDISPMYAGEATEQTPPARPPIILPEYIMAVKVRHSVPV